MIYVASLIGALVLLAVAPRMTRRFAEPGLGPRGLVRLNLGLMLAMLCAVVSLLVFLVLFLLPHTLMNRLMLGCFHDQLCLHTLPLWTQSLLCLTAAGLLGVILWRACRTILGAVHSSRRIARLARTQRLCSDESTSFPVYEIEDPGVVAFTVGFVRPLILVSAGLRRALPQDEFEAVISHELAHAAGRHNLVLLATRMVEKALFSFPGLRGMSRTVAGAVEMLADAAATDRVGDPLLVASGLAKVGALLSSSASTQDRVFLPARHRVVQRRGARATSPPVDGRNAPPAFAASDVVRDGAPSRARASVHGQHVHGERERLGGPPSRLRMHRSGHPRRMTDCSPQRVTLSKAQARAAYDRLSRWYDTLPQPWERRVVREALPLLAPRVGDDLLEIGPGSGRILVRLARQVGPTGRVTGLDLSPGMLAATRRRVYAARLGERVRLRLGDATHLPFRDESFTGAFIGFALETLDTPAMSEALDEIRRTLAVGGRLLVVSLSRTRSGPVPRLYGAAHEHLPAIFNARPIDATGAVRDAGFAVEKALVVRIWGFPVEMVLGRKRVDPSPT